MGTMTMYEDESLRSPFLVPSALYKDFLVYYRREKKGDQGKKCHVETMRYSEGMELKAEGALLFIMKRESES